VGEITHLEYLECKNRKEQVDNLVAEYVELYLHLTDRKDRYTSFGKIEEYNETDIVATYEETYMGTTYSTPITIFTTILFKGQEEWVRYIQGEIDKEQQKKKIAEEQCRQNRELKEIEEAKNILRNAGYKV
jgi:hypothetical protein